MIRGRGVLRGLLIELKRKCGRVGQGSGRVRLGWRQDMVCLFVYRVMDGSGGGRDEEVYERGLEIYKGLKGKGNSYKQGGRKKGWRLTS